MSITASDLVQLSRLLDEAMALAPASRPGWLQALPASLRHLRETLSELLAEHELPTHGGFLHTLPKLGGSPAGDDTLARAGDGVGPYELVRELGRGGMGTVWLARRVDGKLSRQVALKLPRLMWGAGLAERMARERDIGALLEHPHIARLYDAGIDGLGRPYLALEYIDGQPIDTWCQEHALPVRERLRLVAQVARAVAYAHARLVVHRDLKPSNILVTPDGQTHLLDFGIARRLHDDGGAADAALTKMMGRVLTPHYASPEQLRGDAITVVSDVYSLGVLLYELLTGCCPHQPERASLASLEQAILECDPPLASSRAGDHASRRALRGEVDAIVAKAMKRLPEQRYGTVDAFADDIERHLNGERVQARPDSAWYRSSKLLARHRTVFAATTISLLAIGAGAATSLTLASLANDSAQVTRSVTGLLTHVLRAGAPQAPDPLAPRGLPAAGLLDRSAELIGTELIGQHGLQAELYGVVARTYQESARPAHAAHYAEAQVKALRQAEASNHDKAHALLRWARSLLELGRSAEAAAPLRQALQLAQGDAELTAQARLAQVDAALMERRLRDADHGLGLVQAMIGNESALSPGVRIDTLTYRARWLRLSHGLEAALPVYQQALAAALAAEGPLSKRAASIQRRLANALREAHRPREAQAYLSAALRTMRTLGGDEALNAALTESATARRLYELQAIPFERAQAMVSDAAEFLALHPDVPASALAQVERDLGAIYVLWGDLARGEPMILSSTEALRDTANSSAARFSLALLAGTTAREAGRHDEADAWLREAIAARLGMGPGGAPDAPAGEMALAINLIMQGRLEEAQAVLELPAPAATQVAALDSPTLPSAWARLWLARLRLAQGDAEAALALVSGDGDLQPDAAANPRAHAWAGSLAGVDADVDVDANSEARPGKLTPAAPPVPVSAPSDPWLEQRLLVRGAALCALGRTQEGLALLRPATTRLAQGRYIHHPAVAYWRATTGLCALDAGQRLEALRLGALSKAAFAQQPGVSGYFKAPSAQLQARLRAG